jgi:CO/xanthine dehydrogenase FAD-binding subunit
MQAFVKFTLRKPVDFAVVSVACVIARDNGICKDSRIVLGAVAPVPMRAAGAEEAIKGKVVIAITKALVKQALLKDVERRQ